jgi:hypothetical protein
MEIAACTACETGLVISGSYCVCSTGLRQKSIPCSLAPCATCPASCGLGQYPPS